MYRLIAKDTIEEAILLCAQSKLRLEQDMAALESGEYTLLKNLNIKFSTSYIVSGTLNGSLILEYLLIHRMIAPS